MPRRLLLSLIFVIGLVTSACGGGSSSSTSPPPPQVAVSVSPSSAQMLPGENQQFNATVTGTTNTSVNWAVNGTAGGNSTVGTITAAGLYTAPASAPSGNVTITATSAASSSAAGNSTVTVVAPKVTAFAASRFLDQSTFGATAASIRQVQLVGFEQYIADQIAATASTYPDPDADPTMNSPAPYQQRFIVNALTGPDQLRQRVAFALQKIWVVSWVVVNIDEMYLTYLRMHHQHAFSNYRQIMENVALNPAMGQYQDIANNGGVNISGSPPALSCNENFGRELMQLFTVGVWQLNQDGSLILQNGQPVPTYDQAIVEANACALTGWTYPKRSPTAANWPRPIYWTGPLEAVESFHDTSSKTLLNGFTLPPGQTTAADLRDTLDNLNTYPSTPPFVSRLLIQQFVTSNPSPQYISRVAQAFIDGRYVGATRTFGATPATRGDMQAIIAAILLDAEARAGDDPAATQSPNFGKLREPVLFVIGALRSLGAQSDGATLVNPFGPLISMGQRLFFPPTVFSYFSPEYGIPGTNLLGPESNIQNTSTSLVRANFANTFSFGNLGTGTTMDFTPWANLAQQSTTVLLDELNRILLHGTMSSNMRASITTAVNAASTPQLRAQTAIYLVLTSSQYNIQR